MTYTRDTLGRITAVSATVNGVATPITTNRTYRADGLLLSQTYGNGLNETRQYDQKGQLTYQSLGTADTRVYGYDPTGNLTTKQSLPEVASYGYDVLDRLVHEATAALTGSFGYDTNGNRLSASFNNLNTTLGYTPNSNRLTQVSAYGQTLPVALDASGNTVGLPSLALALAYDEAGRLTAIERSGSVIARYVYNAHGQRTRKTAGSTTTVYHYDLAGNLIAETTANGTPIRAYVHADDTPLAQIERVVVKKIVADRLVYLHIDHLDTPRVGTNANQTVVWRWEGEAFGALPPNTDPDGDGKKTIINLRLPGQYYDAESGLFYNWNRYYSPVLGRYISSDPIGLRGGLNTYAYVDSNPLRWTDPTGLAKVCEYVLGGYYNNPITELVQPELGYWDPVCRLVTKPQPNIPDPFPRRRPGFPIDPNPQWECRGRKWVVTQEAEYRTRIEKWQWGWMECKDTCTGEITKHWVADRPAGDGSLF